MSEPPIDPPVEEEIIEGWSTAPVTGDRVDVNENSFIAGDPEGARIEIRSTGFHAFNGTGTETAHIDGAGGAINAGSFSTASTSGTRIYMHNTARGAWPAIVFQTPGLYRSAAIAAYDGVHSDQGVWPNGTMVMWSGRVSGSSEQSDVSVRPTSAVMQTRGADGTGATVRTDNLGNAQLQGTLGNLLVAGSNGTSTVSSSSGSSVSAFVSGGAQMTSAGGGLFAAHSAGEASMWANNTERIRATSTGVNITGVLNVGTTDVMAYIAGLEARIAALEA